MSGTAVSAVEIQAILAAGPYRGLAPYEDSDVDALFFFGRERETEIIVANLMAARLTVLYGPSGVGKSSLLRAGVAQRLRAAASESRERRRRPELAVVVFSDWRDDPVRALRQAVADAVEAESGGRPAPVDSSLAETLAAWSEPLGIELYLLLDQVEEYFLYHGRERGEGTFAEELPELVNLPGLRVNVLLGIREDALAKLDFFKARIPRLLSNYLRLDHLDRDAGHAAILKPLEQFERFAGEAHLAEPALVETVLDQVAAGRIADDHAGLGGLERTRDLARIEAPYLQLVLQRLWEVEGAAGSRTLRLATFDQLGGAQQIVEDHVERALGGLGPDEKAAAAEVFKYLVTPSGTKIAHGIGDLAQYAGIDERKLAPVLSTLVQERVLRPLPAPDAPARARYEIYHDVLADRVLAWRAAYEADRELERQRLEADRRHRRILGVAVASLLALGAMIAVAVFALAQRSDARSAARDARSAARAAHARELSASAISLLDSNPLRSVDLAAQAARLEPTEAAEDVLRGSLLASRARVVFPAGTAPVSAAAYSPDGSRVVTADGDGTARIFRADGRVAAVLRHRAPVNDATFSPDGRLVATASRDGTARFWTAAGRPIRSLRHGAAVLEARFSPDSRLLVTTAADATVNVWTRAGTRLYVLHEPRAVHVVVSPDGRFVVSVGADRFARVYELVTGRLLYSLEHDGKVQSAAFGPESRLLITGSADWKAREWDLQRGSLVHVLAGHYGQVLDVAVGPRGGLAATASADGTGRIWDVHTGALVAVLIGHTNFVDDVSFSPNGLFVVTSSRDGTARAWKTDRGTPLGVLAGHQGAVTAASFSPRGTRVLSYGQDGTARIWDPGIEPELRLLGSHAGPVTGLDARRDGKLVVSAGADGTARIWRVGGGLVATLHHRGPVTDAAFSPDGKLVVTASRDHTARLWSAAGSPVRTLRHPAAVDAVAVSPDSRLVATAAADGVARLWTVHGGRLVGELRHPAPVGKVTFNPNGTRVATAAADRTVRVWRVTDGKLERVLRGHRGKIVSLSFSRDGRRIVTASTDRTARIWNADSGRLEHELRGHVGALTSARFSPDEKLVATASIDHDAALWDARTGERRRVLRAHFAIVSDARFSPDGRWIVTAGPGTAGLWSTASGRLLMHLRGHVGPLVSALFTPDGRNIVTAGIDGSVRVYRCEVCGRIGDLEQLAKARLALAR